MWPEIRETFRRLRRVEDEFVYEPVVVGSFEDAVLAVVFNHNLQAVVISDGFGYPSQYTVPVLREILARQVQVAEGARGAAISGSLLAQMVRRWRPELDVYLTTDRDVARLAGSAEAAPIRRIFYGVEEPMEIHLAILDGVKDRYETPYFDNLKHYAQRPIGTFHALPVARGKSIFKSNWIRDMGEFYGVNLFLAESSATTGGLDSLLEPTGNIKVAQDKAARALGGDRSFFVTNGTSTSNKIVHQALLGPGDIVLIDRDCHKSHHYGLVLAGAQPLYIDAFPLTAVLDVRQPRHQADQEGAAAAQGRGQARPRQAGRADQLHLRRPRRQRPADDAGVPGDQAGPDLPLGRGVVRLRALLAVPAPAHGDGRGGGASAS